MFSNISRITKFRTIARQLARPNVRTMSVYDPPIIIPDSTDIHHPIHPPNLVGNDDTKSESKSDKPKGNGDGFLYMFIGLSCFALLNSFIKEIGKRQRNKYSK